MIIHRYISKVAKVSKLSNFVPFSLQKFERSLENFHEELTRERYLNLAGLKKTMSLIPIYERYQSLFALKTIQNLSKFKCDPRRKRYLLEFTISTCLENLFKEITENITAAETMTTVEFEGTKIPYRSLPSLIANEKDIEKRHILYELQSSKGAEFNSFRLMRFSKLNEQAGILGFKSYIHLCDELKMLQLSIFTPLMKSFLEQTRELYFDRLEEQLSNAGIPHDQAYVCDINVLFRTSQFDTYLSREKLIPSLYSTLYDLGIDISQQSNITLDLENRPLKDPRACCSVIRIPQEIKLVIAPKGGYGDYSSILHEAGHAQHMAHTDSKLPFAYKFCGDLSVTEAYAFLFDYLLCNKYWIEKHLNFTDSSKFIKLIYFLKLYFLRLYATKLLYEQELYTSLNIPKMSEIYAEMFGRNLGIRFDKRNYLGTVYRDRDFLSAIYLRAWICEVQLRQFLEHNFDERWFIASKAGEFLKSLWRKGLKFNAEEIVKQLGYKGLDINPLIDEIRRELKS